MKKIYFLIASMLLGCIGTANAQITNENDIIVTDQEGNQEVIQLPEGMTMPFDSLMIQYNNKVYLTPDPDCNFRDINPSYPKEVYIERLQSLPNIIEMPYNDEVQKVIDRYSGRFRQSVSTILGAANFYMPIFEQALEEYGLPLELKYLPVIESALNPKAVSRAGATGLWQFMLSTGKQYGLEVNSLVDERCDPIKASYAAAQYLKDLYRIYNDWNLVIAAYNCGPDNISKAIHRSNGETDYWRIYPYLPKETRGYVPAFIAANYIMNYYCEHNICPMRTRLPAKTDTVMVSKNVHLEQVAAVCHVDLDVLRALNPQYRRNIVNGATKLSVLRLPTQAVNVFIDNEDSIYQYNAERLLRNRVEVPIEAVEVAYVAPERTSRYSSRSSKIVVRDKGRKGRKGRHERAERHRKHRRGDGGGQSVTVKSGQTLSEIARRNHTTVAKLKKLNKIKGTTIQKGKKLKVK